MRQGRERRLRHDVGAKALTITEAEAARDLVSNLFLSHRANDFVGLIRSTGYQVHSNGLSHRVLSEVAHKLLNDSLERFKSG